MIRLIASELVRVRSRRTLRLLLFACFVAITIGVGIATAQSKPPTPEALAEAQRIVDREMRFCLRGNYLGGGDLPPGYETLEEYCEDNVRLEYFLYSAGIRSDQIPEILLGSSWLVSLLGAVLGATFVGADWSAGTMTTLLTWESRRTRVLLVRGLVSACVVLVVTAAVQTYFALLFRLGVSISGTAETFVADVFRNTYETIARNSVAAAFFCVAALATATLTRSTVGGLGVIGGYLIVVEGFIANLVRDLQLWLPLRGIIVFLTQEPLAVHEPNTGKLLFTIGHGMAGITLTAWVVALAAAALVSFRTRDVT